MKRVGALLTQDLEEVECLMVVDPLRRAEVQVTLVSVDGERVVTGSYSITIVMNRLIKEVDLSTEDVIFLPDSVPEVSNLVCYALVAQTLKAQAEQGKEPAVIRAAPSVFEKMGPFTNKCFTCYSDWEKGIDDVNGAEWTGAMVEQSKGLTTGHGLGTATDSGLALVVKPCGNETAEKIKHDIQHLDTLYD